MQKITTHEAFVEVFVDHAEGVGRHLALATADDHDLRDDQGVTRHAGRCTPVSQKRFGHGIVDVGRPAAHRLI